MRVPRTLWNPNSALGFRSQVGFVNSAIWQPIPQIWQPIHQIWQPIHQIWQPSPKSGSPSTKSGSPSAKSGSPSTKSGSPADCQIWWMGCQIWGMDCQISGVGQSDFKAVIAKKTWNGSFKPKCQGRGVGSPSLEFIYNIPQAFTEKERLRYDPSKIFCGCLRGQELSHKDLEGQALISFPSLHRLAWERKGLDEILPRLLVDNRGAGSQAKRLEGPGFEFLYKTSQAFLAKEKLIYEPFTCFCGYLMGQRPSHRIWKARLYIPLQDFKGFAWKGKSGLRFLQASLWMTEGPSAKPQDLEGQASNSFPGLHKLFRQRKDLYEIV